jgi:hypothetical protein
MREKIFRVCGTRGRWRDKRRIARWKGDVETKGRWRDERKTAGGKGDDETKGRWRDERKLTRRNKHGETKENNKNVSLFPDTRSIKLALEISQLHWNKRTIDSKANLLTYSQQRALEGIATCPGGVVRKFAGWSSRTWQGERFFIVETESAAVEVTLVLFERARFFKLKFYSSRIMQVGRESENSRDTYRGKNSLSTRDWSTSAQIKEFNDGVLDPSK